MPVESRPYKYESLQVLLTVVLGFVHVAFYMVAFVVFIVLGPHFALLGIAVGALEIAASWKLSVGLAVLRFWLLAVGVITTAFSLGCLAYVVSVLG